MDRPRTLPTLQGKKSGRRPDVLFRLLKQIALDVGKNKDETIKAAGQGVMKETGIDVMGMISMGDFRTESGSLKGSIPLEGIPLTATHCRILA